MNTSTSLQALAALAVGSALLASATPADAARGGGFRSAPAQVTRAPAPTSVPRSNARSLIGDLGKIGSAAVNEVKTVGGDIVAGKVQNIPGDVLKTGSKVAGAVVKTGVNIFTLPPPTLPSVPPAPTQASAPPAPTVFKHTGQPKPTTGATAPSTASTTPTASTTASTVLPGTTSGGANGATIKLTPTPASTSTTSSPTTSTTTPSSTTPSSTTVSTGTMGHPGGMQPSNYPTRPQYAGRPGYGYAPAPAYVAPAPAYVAPAPAYVAPAPAYAAPAQTYPVQPSCLRQAQAPDGQVVTFNVCTNQAVVGPQVQAQPQTQTQ
jgi:hypothetical protein